MSDNNSPGGQRLRWWQDEKTATPANGGVVARAEPAAAELALVIPDIGSELEQEALRRSGAELRGERVVIYANPSQNNARLLKRIAFTSLALGVYIGVLALLTHQPMLLLSLLLFALEFALIYIWLSRVNARQTQPIVTLTTEGIDIHSLWQDLGLVRWDEIAQIRAYNCIYRYVGIVLKDSNALCARLGGRNAWFVRANEACVRWVYRPLRLFAAPINLAQQLMPITADELVAQIESFRMQNQV